MSDLILDLILMLTDVFLWPLYYGRDIPWITGLMLLCLVLLLCWALGCFQHAPLESAARVQVEL